MTETVYTNSQEEYEDDFEKDLDWLISEESRSEDQVRMASLRITYRIFGTIGRTGL